MVLVSEFLNIYLLAKKVGSVGFERFLRVWSLVSSCVELGFFVCRVWGSSCVEFGLFVCRVAYACCGAWLLAEWRGGCEGWGQQAKSDGLRLPIMRDKGCEG